MSTAQDTTIPPPLPNLRHRRTASPDAGDDPSGSDRRRQKRRRIEVDSGVEFATADGDQPHPQSEAPSDITQSSTILAQISTWEIPPDVAPTGEQSAASVPIELSNPDHPIVVSPKAASGSPIVTLSSPSRVPPSSSGVTATSTPEPLSAYTCPICFSPPTNATLTPCGHICCGQCLFTAVKSTIRRNMVVAMDRAPAAKRVPSHFLLI